MTFHTAFSYSICLAFLFTIVLGSEGKSEASQAAEYVKPSLDNLDYIAEPFHSLEEFQSRWVLSSAKKDGVEENISKYDGKWAIVEPKENPLIGDKGLVFSSEARHGAVSGKLKTPFNFEDKPFIVQYEVRFQNKHECGGAYIKLLADAPELSLDTFNDKTEYAIMFGPDKCGGDSKLHFIFQHKNPINGKMEEKHAKKPSGDFSNIFDDQKTHLVRLVVKPDNTFEVYVDKRRVNEGSLLHNFEPAVNPPKEIDDPNDQKPDDWDEREKIPDPDAVKPDDWDEDAPKQIEDPNAKKPEGWLDDEPELIPDPQTERPADWDDEEDGEWEAPQIDNPKCKEIGCGEWKPAVIDNPNYKGKWAPSLIANPKYKGIWSPKKIANPEFFEDNNPFAMKSIVAVGFELWSMQADILFDNLLVADDLSLADQWTLQTWDLKHTQEVNKEPGVVGGLWNNIQEATQERPWLWVIFVVLVLLPFVLIYFFCFGGKEDQDAIRKKTDEPTQDDDVEENSEDEPVEDKKESDPEGTEENEDGKKESEESGKENEEITDEKTKSAVSPNDDNEVDTEKKLSEDSEESKEEEDETPSPKTRASKRKTRKE